MSDVLNVTSSMEEPNEVIAVDVKIHAGGNNRS
jgi:hypothetical protein